MNDYEYTFHSDVWEKKNIAQSARNKVCGANSTKVSLAQDLLTRKELEAMNGEVVTYNLAQPMTWKQFRQLPRDLQKEYLEILRKRYNVSTAAVSRMLGIDKDTFYMYTKDTVLSDPVKHRRMTAGQAAEWAKYISQKKNEAVAPVNDKVTAEEPAEEAPVVEEPAEEATEVFRAHDYQVEEPAPCSIQEPRYAAIPALSFRLTGTPGEMLLSLQGLLNALPWNETYEADISMAMQDGDLL